MAKSKISFKVNLSELVSTEALDKLSQSTKKRISGELGEFIVDKILEDTSNQRSSVSGQKWKALGWNEGSKKYKEEKSKIAPGDANLELHGDMLDALRAVAKPDGVEVGVYGKLQSQKADGHCHYNVYGQSKLPVRRFIPFGENTLRSGIMKEVQQIAKDLVVGAPKKRGLDGD